MFNNIPSKNLIFSDLYVREPVDYYFKKIKNNSNKKIILSGERGSGKTTILYNYQNKLIGTESPCILTRLDSCGIRGTQNKEAFDIRFFEHYYELILTHNLLAYIKKHYSLIYDDKFKSYQEKVNKISNETDRYLNFSAFESTTLKEYLEPFILTNEIINSLKNNSDVQSLELAIDRFDWTNSNTDFTQIILSKYFEIFDKIIITTDDRTLLDKEKRISLEEKKYSFTDINYGNNLQVIKTIIQKRIEAYNSNLNCGNIYFPNNIINDQTYTRLIKITNGNISLIIDIVKNIISTYQWTRDLSNLTNNIESIANNQLMEHKKLTKILGNKKLYL